MNTSSMLLSTPDISAPPLNTGIAPPKAGSTSPTAAENSDYANRKAAFDDVLHHQIKEHAVTDKKPASAKQNPQTTNTNAASEEASKSQGSTEQLLASTQTEEPKLTDNDFIKPAIGLTINQEQNKELILPEGISQLVNIMDKEIPEETSLASSQQSTVLEIEKQVSATTFPGALVNTPRSLSLQNNGATDPESTEIKLTQESGKFMPPSGKDLPVGQFKQAMQGESQSSESNNSKPSNAMNINPLADYINKSVDYSQQLLKSAEPSLELATKNLNTSTSSLISGIDTNNTLSLEKANTSRLPSINNVENTTAPYVSSKAGSPEWAAEMGNRIRWMGKVNISSAELQLHPAELGSMEIKITTKDDQSSISFITSNNAAKEAIEASLPKLRDLLANSGLQLAQSDVSQHPSSNDNDNTKEAQNKHAASVTENEENTNNESNDQVVRQQGLGQIDHYV